MNGGQYNQIRRISMSTIDPEGGSKLDDQRAKVPIFSGRTAMALLVAIVIALVIIFYLSAGSKHISPASTTTANAIASPASGIGTGNQIKATSQPNSIIVTSNYSAAPPPLPSSGSTTSTNTTANTTRPQSTGNGNTLTNSSSTPPAPP